MLMFQVIAICCTNTFSKYLDPNSDGEAEAPGQVVGTKVSGQQYITQHTPETSSQRQRFRKILNLFLLFLAARYIYESFHINSFKDRNLKREYV